MAGAALAHRRALARRFEPQLPITGPPEWLCAGLELAACTPISVPMAWALCRELEHCMGTAREGGLGVTAPPGRVTG